MHLKQLGFCTCVAQLKPSVSDERCNIKKYDTQQHLLKPQSIHVFHEQTLNITISQLHNIDKHMIDTVQTRFAAARVDAVSQ